MSNFPPVDDEKRNKLVETLTEMANFIATSPTLFSKAFVEGLLNAATRASLAREGSEMASVVVVGDAIQALKRVNLTNAAQLMEGSIALGGENVGEDDDRLTPDEATELIGYVLGTLAGDSFEGPIKISQEKQGENK